MSFIVDDDLHEASLEDLIRFLIIEQRVTNFHLANGTDIDNDDLRKAANQELGQ